MSEIKQFVNVQNIQNWNDGAKTGVDDNGQIAFVTDTDTSAAHLYANGKTYGDGAQSDKVVITKNIMVDGGPLADQVKSKFPNGITAGMDLQEVLMALFCKVLYPKNISRDVDDKASFSIGAPSITVKNGSTNLTSGNIYEVGTSLSFSSTSKLYSKSLPTRYVRNMDYGYTMDDDNDGVYTPGDGNEFEVTWEDKTDASKVNYVNEVTSATGFGNTLSGLKKTGTNNTLTIDATSTVSVGTNTVTVKTTATGGFSATVTHMPAIKVNANNGEQPAIDDDNKSAISYERVDFDSVNLNKTDTSVNQSASFTLYGINPIKFNANSCNYNNKGSDIVSHNGSTINKFVPSGSYKSAGQSVTLYLGFGNSTAANTTGDTDRKTHV